MLATFFGMSKLIKSLISGVSIVRVKVTQYTSLISHTLLLYFFVLLFLF